MEFGGVEQTVDYKRDFHQPKNFLTIEIIEGHGLAETYGRHRKDLGYANCFKLIKNYFAWEKRKYYVSNLFSFYLLYICYNLEWLQLTLIRISWALALLWTYKHLHNIKLKSRLSYTKLIFNYTRWKNLSYWISPHAVY